MMTDYLISFLKNFLLGISKFSLHRTFFIFNGASSSFFWYTRLLILNKIWIFFWNKLFNTILNRWLFLKKLLCCFLFELINKKLLSEMRFYSFVQSLLPYLKTVFLLISFIRNLWLFIFKDGLDIPIFKFRKILANKIYIKDTQFYLVVFERIWILIQIIEIFLCLNRHIFIVGLFIEFHILVILLWNF